MRLVIWNCNMAFHRKHLALMQLKPDVAVVAECAEPDILMRKTKDFAPTSTVWCGHNKDKGLAVFSFGNYTLAQRSDQDNTLKFVMPVDVIGPWNFHLLAVWAFMGRSDMQDKNDPGPLLRATHTHETMLRSGNTIMAGDFNNHTKWDRPRNPRNFARFWDRMDALNMKSAYHTSNNIALGAESLPTHFWRDRKESSPHNCHIDYIFAPLRWLRPEVKVELGQHADWCASGLSDHAPLVLEM
jgi:exodeoxyribonuclease III